METVFGPTNTAINSKTNVTKIFNRLSGTGMMPQILLSLLTVAVLYIVVISIEKLVLYINALSQNRVYLMEDTHSMDDNSVTINVDPNGNKSMPLALSNNERTGPEFTYSFFINCSPSSFREESGLLHIFSKGYPSQYPLACPGVYLHANTNTLRVYLNTFKSWNTYCDVANFPIGKWVHVAIVCKASECEVFINTNLKSRIPFEGYQPYQNYENIICFSKRRIKLPATIPSVGSDGLNVFGSPKGFLSRLTYFNYALGYTDINSLANEGPSSKIVTSNGAVQNPPPYLDDTWWTSKY